jgi:hypothetical protein
MKGGAGMVAPVRAFVQVPVSGSLMKRPWSGRWYFQV